MNGPATASSALQKISRAWSAYCTSVWRRVQRTPYTRQLTQLRIPDWFVKFVERWSPRPPSRSGLEMTKWQMTDDKWTGSDCPEGICHWSFVIFKKLLILPRPWPVEDLGFW